MPRLKLPDPRKKVSNLWDDLTDTAGNFARSGKDVVAQATDYLTHPPAPVGQDWGDTAAVLKQAHGVLQGGVSRALDVADVGGVPSRALTFDPLDYYGPRFESDWQDVRDRLGINRTDAQGRDWFERNAPSLVSAGERTFRTPTAARPGMTDIYHGSKEVFEQIAKIGEETAGEPLAGLIARTRGRQQPGGLWSGTQLPALEQGANEMPGVRGQLARAGVEGLKALVNPLTYANPEGLGWAGDISLGVVGVGGFGGKGPLQQALKGAGLQAVGTLTGEAAMRGAQKGVEEEGWPEWLPAVAGIAGQFVGAGGVEMGGRSVAGRVRSAQAAARAAGATGAAVAGSPRVTPPTGGARLPAGVPAIVPVDVARRQPGPVRVDAPDDEFALTVRSVGGKVDAEGVTLPIYRFQDPNARSEYEPLRGIFYNAGVPDEVTGMYIDAGNVRGQPGGSHVVQGTTLFRRPLIANTGPEIQAEGLTMPTEAALLQLTPGATPKQIGVASSRVQAAAGRLKTAQEEVGFARRDATQFADAASERRLAEAEQYFGKAYDAWKLEAGGMLRDAGVTDVTRTLWDLEEAFPDPFELGWGVLDRAAVERARAAGYDSILGYHKNRGIVEIIDLREAQFPGLAGEFTLRPEYKAPVVPGGAMGILPGGAMAAPAKTPQSARMIATNERTLAQRTGVTAATPFSRDNVMKVYAALTPGRVERLRARVLDAMDAELARKKITNPNQRKMAIAHLSAAWDAARNLLADSQVTATAQDARQAVEFATTGRITSKFEGAKSRDEIDFRTQQRIDPTLKRATRDEAHRFVDLEGEADDMVTGATNKPDDQMRNNGIARVYAHTTEGEPDVSASGAALYIVWKKSANILTNFHHHWGLRAPGHDIHTSNTPKPVQAVLFEDPHAVRGATVAGDAKAPLIQDRPVRTGWETEGIDVGGGKKIASTDLVVGPEGAADMRIAGLMASMPEKVLLAAAKGKYTPEQLAAILLMGAPGQDQPAVTMARKALDRGKYINPKTGKEAEIPLNADESTALNTGGAPNRSRSEGLVLEPHPRDVEAIYLVGTEAGLNTPLDGTASPLTNGRKVSQMQLAELVRAKIKRETGQDVPIKVRTITAETRVPPELGGVGEGGVRTGSKLISDAVTVPGTGPDITLAPGRARIRDLYTSALDPRSKTGANFPDIGAVPTRAPGDIPRWSEVPTPPAARPFSGAALRGDAINAVVGGGIGATQGDTPEERLRNAAIGAGIAVGGGRALIAVPAVRHFAAWSQELNEATLGQVGNRPDTVGLPLPKRTQELLRERGIGRYAAASEETRSVPGATAEEAATLPSVVRRVFNSTDYTTERWGDLGGAGYAEDGVIKGIHVTDDPQRVVGVLMRGEPVATRGGGDLGDGLYMSDRPGAWMSRTAGKWDFLDRLTDAQRTRLADALRNDEWITKRSILSTSERERAQQLIDRWLSSGMGGYIVDLAGPPYGLEFWKPEYLQKLGIEAGRTPQQVPMEVRGKFAEVAHYLRPSENEALQAAGFDGAYIRGGMGSTPQLVVWNPAAVTKFGDWQRLNVPRPGGPFPGGGMLGFAPTPGGAPPGGTLPPGGTGPVGGATPPPGGAAPPAGAGPGGGAPPPGTPPPRPSHTLLRPAVGAIVGGAAGATQGDTPEERLHNAIVGAGVGIAGTTLAPDLARYVARQGSIGKAASTLSHDVLGALREARLGFSPDHAFRVAGILSFENIGAGGLRGIARSLDGFTRALWINTLGNPAAYRQGPKWQAMEASRARRGLPPVAGSVAATTLGHEGTLARLSKQGGIYSILKLPVGIENWAFERFVPTLMAETADDVARGIGTRGKLGKMAPEAKYDTIMQRIEDIATGVPGKPQGQRNFFENLANLVILSPNWTRGQLRNVGQIFSNSPEGELARRFWTATALMGVSMAAGISVAFGGKDPRDLLNPNHPDSIINPRKPGQFMTAWLPGGRKISVLGPYGSLMRALVAPPAEAVAQGWDAYHEQMVSGAALKDAALAGIMAAVGGGIEATGYGVKDWAHGRLSVPAATFDQLFVTNEDPGTRQPILTETAAGPRMLQGARQVAKQALPIAFAPFTEENPTVRGTGPTTADKVAAVIAENFTGQRFTPAPHYPDGVKEQAAQFLESKGIYPTADPVARFASGEGISGTDATAWRNTHKELDSWMRDVREKRVESRPGLPVGRDQGTQFTTRMQSAKKTEEGKIAAASEEFRAGKIPGNEYRDRVNAAFDEYNSVRRHEAVASLGMDDAAAADTNAIYDRLDSILGKRTPTVTPTDKLLEAYQDIHPAPGDQSRAGQEAASDARAQFLAKLSPDQRQALETAQDERAKALDPSGTYADYIKVQRRHREYSQMSPYLMIPDPAQARAVSQVMDRARQRMAYGIVPPGQFRLAVLLDPQADALTKSYALMVSKQGARASNPLRALYRQQHPELAKYYSDLLAGETVGGLLGMTA